MFLEMMAHTDFRTYTGTYGNHIRRSNSRERERREGEREREIRTCKLHLPNEYIEATYRDDNLQIVGGQFFKLRPWQRLFTLVM